MNAALRRVWLRLQGIPVEDWDSHYASQRWRHDQHTEGPRYARIAAAIAAAASNADVLDLGCGTAALRHFLQPYGVRSYTGVDLSSEAIGLAEAEADAEGRAHLVVADIPSWQPPAHYDAIVFNEVLYYLASPLRVVNRYAQHLTPAGVLVVSVYHPTSLRRLPLRLRLRAIERSLTRQFQVVDKALIRNEPGVLTWWISVLRPRSGH